MKRLTCTILVAIMVLSSVTAYASTDTLFKALETDIVSAKTRTELSMKLNKPFEFINEFMGEEDMNYVPFDVKMLAESACNATEIMDMSYSISEDGKKVRMACSTQTTLPLQFSDNFKADIWSQVGFWVDADFTDEQSPYCRVTYKVPFSKKYLVLDYADVIESSDFSVEKFTDYVKKYSDEEVKKEMFEFFKELVVNNMTIHETSNNRVYVLKTDDQGFKNMVKATAEKLFDVINDSLGVKEELDSQDYRYQFEQYLSVLDEFNILGKDGISVKVTLKNGLINISEFSMHIDCNLHDALSAFGIDMSKYTRDKWWLDLTLNVNTTYEDVNKDINIEFPELTEENSKNIFDDDYNYEYMYDTAYVNTKPVEANDDGKFTLPLKDAMAGFRIAKKYYTVDGDKIVITPREGHYNFTTSEMTVGSNILTVDGVQTTLYTPVTKDDKGVVSIPVDAISAMTGYRLESTSHYFNKDNYRTDTVYFTKDNPDYNDEDDLYISEWMNIYEEGTVVYKNGEIYLPLRNMMVTMGIPSENISVNNGEITITNSNPQIPEFAELKVKENSKNVYIDSNMFTLNNPVIEEGAKAYIPTQFLSQLGCRMVSFSYYFDSNNYSIKFRREKVENQDIDKWQPEVNYLYISEDNKPVKKDGEYYLPLWPTMGELKVSGDNIIDDGQTVTITSTDPATGFKILKITGASIILDGKELSMSKPMVEQNNKKYIPFEFITNVLGGTIESIDIRYQEEVGYTIMATVPNPLYTEE
ncbi:MAG: stalk domain-containing protein [Eubacteriales bacterium]|nr:stalk domain-containing protein [Eubacteriales bacterium]